ncbi:MAG: hypothetical protein D6776_10525 [Planctomycetota bacterium]|nr:MAG: hypothetical protein D6776_10525 [Planctomycetota bacterium]
MRRYRATVQHLLLTGCLLAVSALGSGCTYAHDRVKDAVDVIGFKVLAGPGFKVGAGFGAAKTGLNFGYYRFEKFGFQGRAAGVWEETGTELLAPADHRLEAVWGNKELFDMVAEFQQVDGTASRAGLFDTELTYPRHRYHVPDGLHLGDTGLFFPAGIQPGFLGLGDIQLTAAFFVGFEFNFSMYQLVDFVLGWFYIDIAKDDTRNYTPVGPTEEE